jgi:hypothetical protein
MDKHLLILALETLLEQLECSDRDTETLERQARVQEQIDIIRIALK